MASTKSRNKLKAFQCPDHGLNHQVENAGEEAVVGDKENVNPEGRLSISQDPDVKQKKNSPMRPPACPSSQKSSTKDARDCPQTPVGRLPLSQLLATGEDGSQDLSATPLERVLWENSPPEFSTNSSSQLKKKRKRAVSSSPASSAPNVSSKSKKSINLQALQDAFRTPKADIIDDLWSRYSLHTNHDRLHSPEHGHMPHTFHSSSPPPQTPGPRSHTRDSTGLRRAFSNIEWPTSAAKRRRLTYNRDGRNKTIESADFDHPLGSIEHSKISRVSLLLEKLHKDLAKPIRHPEPHSDASLSSPVPRPDVKAANDETKIEVDRVVNGLSQTAMVDREITEALAVASEESANICEKAPSEFDDDDLDLGMLEVFVGTTDGEPAAMTENVQKGREAGNEQRSEDIPSQASHRSRQPAKSLQDEFEGDSEDDEMIVSELETVFAKYDMKAEPKTREDQSQKPIQNRVETDENASKEPRQQKVKTEAFHPASVLVVSDDEDEFGGDSDFEQAAAELDEASCGIKKDPGSLHSAHRKNPVVDRHIIKNISQDEYETEPGIKHLEKVLHVQDEKNKLSKIILLRQAWFDSPCSPGDRVHLVGDFNIRGECIVDNAHNYLVLYPDHLVSSTVVGDSFTCMRKAVLADRVKATSDANQSTIYGHMLHEIFQEALKVNRWDETWMAAAIERITRNHLEDLFEVNMEQSQATEEMKARVAELQAWAGTYISAEPKPNAVVQERNGGKALMSIDKLLEVEEKVWSPRFGLKGNVDATVQIQLDKDGSRQALTVPFELKTGKHSSAAHKAQTSLYTLLLTDRYDVEIACGVLYYMQSSEISTVRAMRHELLPMILQRNILAGYIREKTKLPAMVKNLFTCGKCYAKTTCFLYHKLSEDGNGETSGLGDKFDDLVRHLKPAHQAFFMKWDDLLTKEEKNVVRLRRELWTLSSTEREKNGRCYSGVIIEPGSYREEVNAPKINRFTYNFVKRQHDPGFSFLESQITVGEPVVISDEQGHFALANGYVNSVRRTKIQVTVDRKLHNARARESGFDPRTKQSFVGIMKVVQDGLSTTTQVPQQSEEPVIYRLDKDEFSNGMALVRNNLIRLMENDLYGVHALRRLIVDQVAPTFRPTPIVRHALKSPTDENLNVDQKAAIEKVLSAKDYALVLGMPGTGKTTTIAHIIRTLAAQNKTVLLTSYTHTAVDNILLKLRKDNIGIFRVGALPKIHPEVKEFADLAGRPKKTTEELRKCYDQPVVASTCLGVNHPIFNQRVFDYCIVDEASQITLPVCLGPIRMAKTFILVGDHYQLPPLVQNKEALEGGLDISLFKLLSDTHPDSVVNLEHQYRMCEEIMTLSNTLIYNGRLKCGTESVARQELGIPDISLLKKHHHTTASVTSGSTGNPKTICLGPARGRCWLRDLLDPSVKACFVDTGSMHPSAREVLEHGSRIINPAEAALTSHLVEALLTTGIYPGDIGVVTLYRSQLALIKQSLRHRPGIEMHTADRFQGRDKEVVILSLVRSNDMQIVGDLLKDWRRVNVALTRARTKLLILGNRKTLIGNALLKDLMSLMEGKGWWYELPASALEGHVFEEGGTQLSSSKFSGASGAGLTRDDAIVLAEETSKKDEAATAMAWRGEGEENVNRGHGGGHGSVKRPLKQGRLDPVSLIGKRPVLRDIVNDAA